MPIRQVTVPYIHGYDFGIGADLASGSPMAKVVDGEVTGVEGSPGATVDFTIQRIRETSELETALGIDVEASYGSGAFGASASLRFSFAKECQVQSSSLFMSITANIKLGFLQIDDPVLSEYAGKMLEHPDIFTSRYGNVFVRGIEHGGFFVGILRIDTGSSEESETISGELAGTYGLFSAEAQAKFETVQKKYRNDVLVKMNHDGGPVDLVINDPTDPLELLKNANLFLKSFQESPQTVAAPYAVTLAPIEIARGPLPPNAADLQEAQDIIVICAKRRSALLDQINLLDHIREYGTSKYDFSNGADRAAIVRAIQDGEADLDLLAKCASAAINSPTSAKVPTLFAKEIGTTFPTLNMPDPLPLPKELGRVILVPDFTDCTSWQACVDRAKGLEAKREIAHVEAGNFHVVTFDPPKDTPLREGETVKIITNPDKGIDPRFLRTLGEERSHTSPDIRNIMSKIKLPGT